VFLPAFIFGVILVGVGVVAALNSDVMWSLTERTNRARGQVSERSDLWERGNSVGAGIAIVTGVVVIFLSFGMK